MKVVQSYNIERSSDILILDDIKWKYVSENAIKELKCSNFTRSQNQVAVLVRDAASYDRTQCDNFQGLL